MLAMAVDLPYDWDDYRSDFHSSPAYAAQESALLEILTSLSPPKSVLEVGPGLGRVTKILTQLWPSKVNDHPTKFYLSDLSEPAIEQASAACSEVDFTYHIGRLQDARPFPKQTFDLVLAIEVLMHISPSEVGRAISNLLSAVVQPNGILVTCDWTQVLPSTVPIRTQNFCHDYSALFSRLKATILTSTPVGLQTIFLVSASSVSASPVPHG